MFSFLNISDQATIDLIYKSIEQSSADSLELSEEKHPEGMLLEHYLLSCQQLLTNYTPNAVTSLFSKCVDPIWIVNLI